MPDQLWAPPSLICSGYRRSYPEGKAQWPWHETYHSLQYVFIALYLSTEANLPYPYLHMPVAAALVIIWLGWMTIQITTCHNYNCSIRF